MSVSVRREGGGGGGGSDSDTTPTRSSVVEKQRARTVVVTRERITILWGSQASQASDDNFISPPRRLAGFITG